MVVAIGYASFEIEYKAIGVALLFLVNSSMTKTSLTIVVVVVVLVLFLSMAHLCMYM